MATQLNGKNSLWPDLRNYVEWVRTNADEIHTWYVLGDENAAMIVEASCILTDMTPEKVTATWRAAYAVIVERYISEHHPEIAVIVE